MDMARRERVRHISEREVGILDMSIQGIIRQSFHSRPRPRFPISSPKNQNPALPASSQSLCVFSVVAWRGAAVSGELDSWVGGFFFLFFFCGWVFVSYLCKAKAQRMVKRWVSVCIFDMVARDCVKNEEELYPSERENFGVSQKSY